METETKKKPDDKRTHLMTPDKVGINFYAGRTACSN